MSDLRTRIAAAINAVDDWHGVTDSTILADAVIDLLIDLAGQGELLKAIDRMYR